MKIVRYVFEGRESYGELKDGTVREIMGEPFGNIAYKGFAVPLEKVGLLAPSRPKTIAAVGLNYKPHSEEFGMELPAEPIIFQKAVSAVLDPLGKIVRPDACGRMDYEAELAVVIGSPCEKIKKEDAARYVFGYTCLNDVTARDIQSRESQWLRAKSYYTFCPFGPWIETDFNPADVRVRAVLNGRTVQDDNTSNMLFDIPRLLEHISSFMRLEPGDVVATGTPGGIGPMESGDEIKIIIEGIGELVNTVA